MGPGAVCRAGTSSLIRNEEEEEGKTRRESEEEKIARVRARGKTGDPLCLFTSLLLLLLFFLGCLEATLLSRCPQPPPSLVDEEIKSYLGELGGCGC